MQDMSRALESPPVPQTVSMPEAALAPVLAEIGNVRLRWHARDLRGGRSLREAAELVGMNRDELGRIERGETKQIQFQTLAKFLAAYRCTLDDLFEVEVAEEPSPAPLYAGAIAALAASTLPASVPGRRSVRRDSTADMVAESDESSFADSSLPQTGQRRRRSPVGTLNR